MDHSNTIGISKVFGFCIGRRETSPKKVIAPTEQRDAFYKMDHPKRGLAIIFNHELFLKSTGKTRRLGTDVDYKNLVSTFENLGFKVEHYHNLNYKDVIKNLEKVAKEDHSYHDTLIVSVLSHGSLGTICAYDKEYGTEEIWSHFTADKCPSLAGKPKLFFIQACQGDKLDNGITLETQLLSRTQTDSQQGTRASFRIPVQADFLIAFSTIPGFYSWRNEIDGSWFVQALCAELRENGTRYDLLTLLTFVSRRVALDFESNAIDKAMCKKKQVPCYTSMLTRLVKFIDPSTA